MQIKWTKRALNRLESSVNYCQRNFGERVATKYYQKATPLFLLIIPIWEKLSIHYFLNTHTNIVL